MKSVPFDIECVLKWQDVGGNVCDDGVQSTQAKPKPAVHTKRTVREAYFLYFPVWSGFAPLQISRVLHECRTSSSSGRRLTWWTTPFIPPPIKSHYYKDIFGLKAFECVIFPLSSILFPPFLNLLHCTTSSFLCVMPTSLPASSKSPRSNWTGVWELWNERNHCTSSVRRLRATGSGIKQTSADRSCALFRQLQDRNTTKRREVLMLNWRRDEFLMGDPETSFLFHHGEATVKRSDSAHVTLKGSWTTIRLLPTFCCSGLHPVLWHHVKGQTASLSRSRERPRVGIHPGWITNGFWF